MRALPIDVHALPIGVRALLAGVCAPSTLVLIPPHRAHPPTSVRALPIGVRALPTVVHALPTGVCALPTGMRALHVGMCALLVGVRALSLRRARLLMEPSAPPRWCACPPCSRARPAPTHAHHRCNSSYSSVCAFIAGGKTRYIRGRGPLYPRFITIGFVSWDSFVGSLYEAVGMVQHFRF
jgi:hypothetical protein